MRNAIKLIGIAALVAVLLAGTLIVLGCNKPTGGTPKVIADEWQNTLTYGGEYSPSGVAYMGITAVIGENTITVSGGGLGSDVTITGVYTQGGGPVTLQTPGEYTYVYKDGAKIGFMVRWTDGSAICQRLCVGGTYIESYQPIHEAEQGITLDLTGVPLFPGILGLGIF